MTRIPPNCVKGIEKKRRKGRKMDLEKLSNDELIRLLQKRGFTFEELRTYFPPERTTEGIGELEIHHEQGKIYANNDQGRTILRITGLPAPIPEIRNRLERILDIRLIEGATNWSARE